MIEAEELRRYYEQLTGSLNAQAILQYLNQSQTHSVEIWAAGDGTTGMFSNFRVSVPSLFLTSSVVAVQRPLDRCLQPDQDVPLRCPMIPRH
jgi:hypothetical protein